jgi:hypothetical protein
MNSTFPPVKSISAGDAGLRRLTAALPIGPIEITIGIIDLFVAAGLVDILAVEADKHADGNAIIELSPVKLIRIS